MDIYQKDSWSELKMQENKNIYHMNEQDIIQNFKSIFQKLTFNSKPIISDLTDLAKRSNKVAPLIVEIIEEHLKNVPNHQKLPILYLMDSICKNIGGIYLSLFSINLTKNFGHTYNLVDSDTQMKLKRLVNTWKDYPKGPLFPSNILENLNNIINQFQKDESVVNKNILKKAVNSIQTLLIQKLSYQKQYPYDEANNQHIQYLYKAMQILQDPSVTDLQISRFNQEITNALQGNINSPLSAISTQSPSNIINNQIPNTLQPMMSNTLPVQNTMSMMMNNGNPIQSTMPQAMNNNIHGGIIPNQMRNPMLPNAIPNMNIISNQMVNQIPRSIPNTIPNTIANSTAAPNTIKNTMANTLNNLSNPMTSNINNLSNPMTSNISNLSNPMTSNINNLSNPMGVNVNNMTSNINNRITNSMVNNINSMANTITNSITTLPHVMTSSVESRSNSISSNINSLSNSISNSIANSMANSMTNSLSINSLSSSLTNTMPSVIQSSIVTPNISQNIPMFLSSLPILNNIPKSQSVVTPVSSVPVTVPLTVPAPVVKTVTELAKTAEPIIAAAKTKETPKKKYEKFSDFPLIKITDEDIHKFHPEYIEAIYDFLSYQCKQCGRRYYKSKDNDKESEKKIYSHLDWHFRQNRRLKNQSKQILCRGWQDVSEDDWINSKTIEGKFSAPTFFQFDSTNPETENTNNETTKEETKYLPCDGTQKKCFVCNEDFEKHWHEDEEEWMLKDAIERDNKVFHPSCYEDYVSQQKSTKTKEEQNEISENDNESQNIDESSKQSINEESSIQSENIESSNDEKPIKRSIDEVDNNENNKNEEEVKRIKSE